MIVFFIINLELSFIEDTIYFVIIICSSFGYDKPLSVFNEKKN